MGKSGTSKINPLFQTVFIATFSAWKNGKRLPTNGMIEPLLSFFGKKTQRIILIDCTHPGSSDDVIPKVDEYRFGKLQKQENVTFLFPPKWLLEKNNTLKTQPLFKIRDVATVAERLLQENGNIDLFIGLESIHTFVGILFKKLGKVKTVVYYVSDYSPHRYGSKIFNNIYLWLDRFCAMNADYIWDVSPAMMPARIKNGLDKKKAKPCIQVPNALFPFQISYLPIAQLKKNSLLFAGTIGPENGLDLAIEALQLVRKEIPSVHLTILGSGLTSEEEKIKKLIQQYKLEKNITQHGFIADLKKVADISKHSMIGLAPYRTIPWSVRWYADATKMRLYFANGLPAITTQVPPLGKEAQKKECALVTKDIAEPYAKAIISLLQDSKKYKKYRQNAIAFAKVNTWENTYGNALKQMKLA